MLLLVVMLFGMATTASAYTDVSAAAQTGPIEKLSALGIIKGYADGTFRPTNPITRAEFAAVIVRTMGLEQAAKLVDTPTKFSDVTAKHAWAYGYINVASAEGIIKGDPDGKFRPSDTVSFAETITMLLRASGWDAACSAAEWPTGFVTKAVEFGLTEGVAFSARAAANRGSVAIMTYNALWSPMALWNDVTKTWTSDAVTLAKHYLDATEKTVIVGITPALEVALKPNQIVADPDGLRYIPAGANLSGLLGREVRVIQVGADKYVYMADATPSDRIITGVTFVSRTPTTVTFTDGAQSFTKTLAASGYVIRNNRGVFLGDLNTNCDLTIYLDAEGQARYIIANEWVHEQYIVAEKHVKGIDGATSDYFMSDCGCRVNIQTNTVFVRNGKPATFAELAVGDVFYLQTAEIPTGVEPETREATYIELYDNRVTGKVSAVALNAKGEAVLTLSGTNYTIDNAAFSRSYVTLDAANLTKAGIGGLVNFDATLKLNAAGKATVVAGTTTALIGRVVKTPAAGITDKLSVSVRGTETEYTSLVNVAGVVKDDYVAMTQRADGKLTSIYHFHPDTGYVVKSIDTVNRKLTLQDGATLDIWSFSAAAFGVRLGTWGDASMLKVGDEIAIHCPGSSILYFEVNPSAAGHVYGWYIGQTSVEETDYIYVNVKGAVNSYEITAVIPPGFAGLTDLLLDTSGVATAVANVGFEGLPHSFAVNAISGSTVTVTRDDSTVQVHDLSNAVVYADNTGTLGTLADIKVGTTYARVMNGTTVVLILILSQP
jgi:hypothetical protein